MNRVTSVVSFILCMCLVQCLCLAGSEKGDGKVNQERLAWVAKCLKDFESIKPGMTRKDIRKRFPMDGGLQGVSLVRFAHPECPYFKIDVEFSFKRNPDDQNRAVMSPDDKAIKISKPYIEPPYRN